jgi:hypothetical protein
MKTNDVKTRRKTSTFRHTGNEIFKKIIKEVEKKDVARLVTGLEPVKYLFVGLQRVQNYRAAKPQARHQ